MTPRLLEKNIRKAAEHYPVITVTGPKQSGKTTFRRAWASGMEGGGIPLKGYDICSDLLTPDVTPFSHSSGPA